MREIEVKARLRDREGIMKKLTELGCTFGDSITQKDTVYVENVGSLGIFLANSIFLRIRETPDVVLFTIKYNQDKSQNGKAEIMPLEHEVTVSSAAEIQEMIRLMGYTEALCINKIRQSANLNGWEICIDEVEGLGAFIEVEKLAEHDEDVEPVSRELTVFLTSLDIAPEDIGVKRYDIQLLEGQGGGV